MRIFIKNFILLLLALPAAACGFDDVQEASRQKISREAVYKAEQNAQNALKQNAVKQNAVKFDNIEASNAQKFIKTHPNAIILDVRTPSEFANGHIKNAININYKGKNFRVQLTKLDRNAHYILHCKSGVRSGKSLIIMMELGFKRITHMDGGLDAWKLAKLPIAK